MPETGDNRKATKEICGIVMPIAAMGDYSKEHWEDVKGIISDAIEDAGFKPRLVSEAEHTEIIQKEIFQNLYDDPIVVCDVSGKNPNVMFELGIRLAFYKPVVVIKDDKTDFSFDTNIIKHLIYERSSGYTKSKSFKTELKKAIGATYTKSKEDSYVPILQNFIKNYSVKKEKLSNVNEAYFNKMISNINNSMPNINSLIRNLNENSGMDSVNSAFALKRLNDKLDGND